MGLGCYCPRGNDDHGAGKLWLVAGVGGDLDLVAGNEVGSNPSLLELQGPEHDSLYSPAELRCGVL